MLFPIRRPTVGLYVGSHALTVVEIGRDWRRGGKGRVLRQCRQIDLAPGLIRPSSIEANIVDLPAMTQHLKVALGNPDGRAVALSLPDHCARMALFDFETLPKKAEEVEALLRWRFQKDLNLTIGQARMQFRVFRPKGGAVKTGNSGVKVLVAAVREDIVAQYEMWCEAAGAIPMAIGLSSLAVVDMCRTMMTADRTEALFLHASETGFTFIAFRHGCPVFIRIKAMADDQAGTEPTSETPVVDETVAVSEDPLTQEILATLHYYADRDAGVASESEHAVHPIYVVTDQDWQAPALLGDFLPLKVVRIDWQAVRASCAVKVESQPQPVTGLSALAAILAA